MEVTLPYGKSSVALQIPDAAFLQSLLPNAVESEQTGEAEVLRSLSAPIGSPRLKDLVHAGQKVVIVTSDITRPMPSALVLPHVLNELNAGGVADSDVTVVFALGSHREHTEAERKKLAGEEVFRRVACVDSRGEFVHLGETSRGTPVDIFRPVAEADVRICLGNIEFHYFAGYSGGAKAIMPGVSTRDAIQSNHRHMIEDGAVAGHIEGNPIREDIDEVCTRFVPIDFIVNVVLDEKKQIRRCVSGHYIRAHRAGCEYLDRLYKISIPRKADVVVVSAGGYPKDLNLYQAQKALDNAKHAVRDGGTILWIASAGEGLGEKTFEAWMTGHEKPSDMITHISSDFRLGGHKAAAIAMVLEHADILLYSDLPANLVTRMHLTPCVDPQAALTALLNKYGPAAKVICMPYGGSTLPCVEVDDRPAGMDYSIFGRLEDGSLVKGEQQTEQEFMESVMSVLCPKDGVPFSGDLNETLMPEFVSCSAEQKELTLRFSTADWMMNPSATLHGGIISTAADIAAGLLARFLRRKRRMVTVQLSVNFLRIIDRGEHFLVRAVADHVGSRVVVMHVEVISEQSGKVAATASVIFM